MKPGSWSSTVLAALAIFGFFISVLCQDVSSEPTSNPEARRAFIQQMAKEAYGAYVRHAWGHDLLYPVSGHGDDEIMGSNMGYTILYSISTLWVMDMKAEFEQARNWIAANLTVASINKTVSVSNIVTGYIGGLMSAYDLTKDSMFLKKAEEFADVLEPVYDEKTGMPNICLNPNDTRQDYDTDGYQLLSWVASQQLEYEHLSYLTGDRRYANRSQAIRTFFRNIEKPQGLYMTELNFKEGKWESNKSSLFWMSREFYSSLLNLYIHSGDRDEEAMQMYIDAMDAVLKNGMIFKNETKQLYFARDYNVRTGEHMDFMRNDGCYLGGMLSLGSRTQSRFLGNQFDKPHPPHYIEKSTIRLIRHGRLAEMLTETCHQAAANSTTGLPPRIIGFDEKEYALLQKDYYLTPELAESYFLMWRTTHNPKYRDYAWELAQAIEQHCRTKSGGYSAIRDVSKVPAEQVDYQTPNFLAATLKYLYLTFTADSVLPLDKWVFNADGHPLRVKPRKEDKYNYLY